MGSLATTCDCFESSFVGSTPPNSSPPRGDGRLVLGGLYRDIFVPVGLPEGVVKDRSDVSDVACVPLKTTVRRAEYERVAEQAQREGRTVANWLRVVALGQLPSEQTSGLDAGVLGSGTPIGR